MVKQAARNAIKKKGAVTKKKTVTKAKQKKEQDRHYASSSSSPSIRSKFVGVCWHKQKKKWKAEIRIDGKIKHLGYFHDEKEAACKYDEQAALLNKPVNFPQHEGQEQAVKRAPKGNPVWRLKIGKPQAKSPNDDDSDEEDAMREEWDSDEASGDEEDVIIPDQQASSSSSTHSPTFLQHLVHQQVTFLQVKQELTEDHQEATNQAHQAQLDATDDSHLGVVCMDEERGVLYVPCNHLAVCVGCEEGLAAASMACPMCQEPIDRSRSITGIVVS